MLTFQQIIQRLTEFWEKKKCIIHQGHDVEVGAGTFNPSTFLRCLGPEPYNTAYVEPSRRPSDGRYGQNPNRLQLFHQFQVIMKPSPSDIQQLYLDSLQALGLDLKKHDIRFVHDDWESPTVGAWGLGWEVWCDGMEITQFTYFQAMGSLSLKPVSAELTYGLERLAMFIQNKDNIYAVKWNDEYTFADLIRSNEIEWSTYNFEVASIPMWKKHFEDFEKEAKDLIARELPLPAYDFVIKASHAFNLLNARGAISVTERTGYIARIRDLSRLIATAYVESRESMGFPLLKKEKPVTSNKSKAVTKAIRFDSNKKQDFLLEIGSEQLPATFIPIGVANLEKGVKQLLEKHRLSFESLHVFGTPQRLGILVKGLVEGTKETETERRGPSVASAFDGQGTPTPQGLGFLKSMGMSDVTLEAVRKGAFKQLKIDSLKEVEYLFAKIKEPSQSTFSLLCQELPSLITHLEFPKKMRWGHSAITYPRPLHWIVALFGDKIIPFQVGEILSNRFSFGHAQLSRKRFAITSPDSYLKELKKHFVLADIEERKNSILKQLKALEKKCKGQALEIHKVLPQVLHLVEWPQLTIGSFDSHFLKAPQEVLISEMVEHQKYFPLADHKNKLKNQFVITADNKPSELIRRGNERVLSARLSDGVFLYEQDVKVPLEDWNQKLQLMTHQKELGSMLDKVERVKKIAETVRSQLKIGNKEEIQRAALLSKADLASSLVGEFPELQGTVGKYYALSQQEPQSVAVALEEQWMPRFEGAALPQTPTGIVLSFADKLDNLIGCYCVGLKPSSSSDPYALRRQVIGIIRTLLQQKQKVNLKTLLEEACEHFPQVKERKGSLIQEMLQFITARAQGVFEELGFKREEIDSSLQGQCLDPYTQFCKIEALHAFRKSGKEFSKLVEVYKRAKGQLETPSAVPFNPSLATEKVEKELVQALEKVEKEWKTLLQKSDYVKAFKLVSSLQEPLAKLFDEVKILASDLAIRNNRIALLQNVFNLFKELIDFSKIQ